MNAFTTRITHRIRASASPATLAPDRAWEASGGRADRASNSSATGDPTVAPTPTHHSRRWALALLLSPFVLGGCSFFPTYGTSRGATTQGQSIFKLYSGMMTVGIIVGGSVFILILFTVFRYRRRSDTMPRQFHENIPIEIVYTVVPILIVLGLFAFTVITENSVDATQSAAATTTSSGKPVVDLTVTAFQWGWRFDYPRLDVSVAGEGTPGPINNGPEMVVPTGEVVQVTLVSNDVVHGFYVRDFNFQRMALPGVTNVFDLNVVHNGSYKGQCTELCGLYHSEMLFTVRSVSPAAFKQWARAEVATGHTIQPGGIPAANMPPPNTHVTPSNAAGPTASIPAKGAA